MNIYDFITDDVQYTLKEQARRGSLNRFEGTLEEYERLFFGSLEAVSATDLPKTIHPTLMKSKSVLRWLACFRKAIRSDEAVLKQLFHDVIDSYGLFIRGKHFYASLKVHDILERYELLEVADPKYLGVFYRARIRKRGDNTSLKEYYYHLPFDQRRKVGNRRFSFSGLPMLYLGASVVDTQLEMDKPDMNRRLPPLCLFGFNPFSRMTVRPDRRMVEPRLRIFDITNAVYNLVNDIFPSLIVAGGSIPNCDDPMYAENQRYLILAFRRFLLSQLCTFPRKDKQSTFIEEYVIPQLLTEALKVHKYHGVLFPSTRFAGHRIILGSVSHNLSYKSNLAMFTEYGKDPYDEELLANFVIEPLDRRKALRARINPNRVADDFTFLVKLRGHKSPSAMLSYLNEINSQLFRMSELYRGLRIDGLEYYRTKSGKIELFGIRKYYERLVEMSNLLP